MRHVKVIYKFVAKNELSTTCQSKQTRCYKKRSFGFKVCLLCEAYDDFPQLLVRKTNLDETNLIFLFLSCDYFFFVPFFFAGAKPAFSKSSVSIFFTAFFFGATIVLLP